MPRCCWSSRTRTGSTVRRRTCSRSSLGESSLTRSSCWLRLATATPRCSATPACRSTGSSGLDDATAASVARRVGSGAFARRAQPGPARSGRQPARAARAAGRGSAGTRTSDGRPAPLPLTERLERAFAARVSDLPDATRLVLLVAALNDGDAVNEILEAASAVAGTALDLDVAAPAAEARHHRRRSADAPLPPSADSLGGRAERRPGRSVGVSMRHWRMCSAANPTDGRGTARRCSPASMRTSRSSSKRQRLRARRRGAVAVAVTAMRRAAELGEPASRSRRLLAAAGLAVELGRRDVVVPLLREVDQLDLGELDRARVTWVEETAADAPARTSSGSRL